MNSPLLDIARRVTRSGVSVIPIDHSTKRPAGWLLPEKRDEQGNVVRHEDGTPRKTWLPFQSEIADDSTLRLWFAGARPAQSMAIVGGAISGGLEIIDFDIKRFFEAWREDAAELMLPLVHQRTGSGCDQVAYRCDAPLPNTPFAWAKDASKPSGREIAIETRGEGGYAVIAPSLHPSGNRYEMLAGNFDGLPHVDMSTVELLRQYARELNEAPIDSPEIHQAMKSPKRNIEGESIIEQWVSRHRVADILSRHGYLMLGRGEFKRPGKSERGISGHIASDRDRERSFHFSTNDPLNDGRFGKGAKCGAHDAFDLFVRLDHHGDVKAAMRAAAAELGLKHRKDGDVHQSAISDKIDGKEYAALFDGDTTSVAGDVDAAFERMAEILRRHTRSEEQVARISSRSKLMEVAHV